MARTVSIGHQDFETIRKNGYFYIDKTDFIRDWWEKGDSVTLITRPRRFGKTLTMRMVEQFFSLEYAGRSDLFEGLAVWEDEKYRNLQGTWPVLFLSFADIKDTTFEMARKRICQEIQYLYDRFDFLLEGDFLSEREKRDFYMVSAQMEDYMAASSLKFLSNCLYRYYGKKVIILLDEYDTPMQEAYVSGYWKELTAFTRNLFNAAFKTNPALERAIMTGITRVSRESVFSDLNNLEVITTTSRRYAECFGFTRQEVLEALDEYGLSEKSEEVRQWYDGFRFGDTDNIYNPWSVINFLVSQGISSCDTKNAPRDRTAAERKMSLMRPAAGGESCKAGFFFNKKELAPYWVNTSSNHLIGKLLQESSGEIKETFEDLLQGKSITVQMDEQVVYDQLDEDEHAVWSLLLAGGYLKAVDCRPGDPEYGTGEKEYDLILTNLEVRMAFRNMVRRWFGRVSVEYNAFVKALLQGDLDGMNEYMNRVAFATFSCFDTGKRPSGDEPERFYHGFVLGLLVDLGGRYVITSNRESGYGRYDVMLEPRNREDDAMILEFKVNNPAREMELSDTVRTALAQIERKGYEANLTAKGVLPEQIRKYGFAFRGKHVLIGDEKSFLI